MSFRKRLHDQHGYHEHWVHAAFLMSYSLIPYAERSEIDLYQWLMDRMIDPAFTWVMREADITYLQVLERR